MKILADENIPYVHEFFDRFGEVHTAPGRGLRAEDIRDVDILLVRSVTRVNEALLSGSRVKFVGTCTIGTDHLDTVYFAKNHIAYASAPGCNAGGVVQYVLAALNALDSQWINKTVGVIGNGNVGGRLCRTLKAAGVNVCAYDPFLSGADYPYLTSLDHVLACDIVCVHTPYTTSGPHPTHHLIGANELQKLKSGAVLLNAGRGGAIDNLALLRHLERGADLKVVLDVWENEPHIHLDLLDKVRIATPHIAGYSFEGKLNGSAMVYHALVNFLGLEKEIYFEQCHKLMTELKGMPELIEISTLGDAIERTYPIKADDERSRQSLAHLEQNLIGATFDTLRKHYPERREFSHFQVMGASDEVKKALGNLGFLIGE